MFHRFLQVLQAPEGRKKRLRKMLRHKALGLCPKARQGPEAPVPRTLSAPWSLSKNRGFSMVCVWKASYEAFQTNLKI